MPQTVDAAWLAANATAFGGPPYVLGRAFSTYSVPGDNTYALGADVTTPGSAFVVGLPATTIDLNGHTVTYNDATAMTVSNGDFETDSIGATTVTGWDTSLAPGSAVASNSNYLFGSKVLRIPLTPQIAATLANASGVARFTAAAHGLSNGQEVNVRSFASGTSVSGLQTITNVTTNTFDVAVDPGTVTGASGTYGKVQRIKSSSPLAIPVANRLYAVGFQTNAPTSQSPTFAAVAEAWDTTTSTKAALTLTPRADEGAGIGVGFAATLLPTTTHSIRIEIAVYATYTATDATIDVDRVFLNRCYDYGVVATGRGSDLPGFANFPAGVQTYIGYGAGSTVRDTPGTGSITQGQHKGFRCYGVSFDSANLTCTATGLHVTVNGDDAYPVYAGQNGTTVTTDVRVITNNTVAYSGTANVTDRYAAFAAIDCKNIAGGITITGNTLTGCPQCGVSANPASNQVNGSLFTISSNTITVNKVVPNCYAIVVTHGKGLVISSNVIRSSGNGGRGILLDALAGNTIDTVTMTGNDVDVTEGADRQYYQSVPGRALRIRNIADAPSYGTITGVWAFSNNTFTARTDTGQTTGAAGASISIHDNGSMAGFVPTSTDDTFSAVVGTTDTAYEAFGLCLNGFTRDLASAFVFTRPILDSNHISLQVTDTDDGDETANVVLVAPTFRKNAGGAARAYTPVRAGYAARRIENLQVISPAYAGGAAFGIAWASDAGTYSGSAPYREIHYLWRETVTVTFGGSPVFGATVTSTDAQANLVDTQTSDGSGVAVVKVRASSYRINASDSADNTVTTVTRTPAALAAVKAAVGSGSASVSPSADEAAGISFGGALAYLVLATGSGKLVVAVG